MKAADLAKVEKELYAWIEKAAASLGVVPSKLVYNDLQKWMKLEENDFLKLNASTIREMGGFTALRNAKFPPELSPASLRASQVKAVASRNRKKLASEVEETGFALKFEDVAAKIFKGKIEAAGFGKANDKAKPGKITRELNILLSDLHFGADLDPKYVPMKFGIVEEARRLAHVTKSVCNYKKDHRSETRLRVHLAGDIIQGQLHDKRDGDLKALQVTRAMWLLTQMLAHFSREFPEVVVHCTSGNHDRDTSRHTERATLGKVDSETTKIYYALYLAAAGLKNVKFDIPYHPYVSYESFGAKCFGTHGDTVLNVGYPGSVINSKNLEGQINRINASLPNAEEYKLFFLGHVHVGTVIHMGNGTILITNGALIPSDEYAVSIGLFENSCGQTMWESVPGHVVGDYRFIQLNGGIDKDESLDKIIKPFPGLPLL